MSANRKQKMQKTLKMQKMQGTGAGQKSPAKKLPKLKRGVPKQDLFSKSGDKPKAQPLGTAQNLIVDKIPTHDLGKGRMVFAIKTKDGKTIRLPQESMASDKEKAKGLYIPDAVISQYKSAPPRGTADNISSEKPTHDLGKSRKIFPVEIEGKGTIYLPKQSEASESEKLRGAYIPDEIVDKNEKQRQRTAAKDKSGYLLKRAQRAVKVAGGVNQHNIDTEPKPVTEAEDGTRISLSFQAIADGQFG